MKTLFPKLFTLVFIALILPYNFAQIPTVTTDLPATGFESFVGEQFCFEAVFTNTGPPGYGPYYQFIFDPELSIDSTTFLGSSISFDPDPADTFPISGMLTDPVTGDPVTGPVGHKFTTISLPIGSLVTGAPQIPTDICLTIDNGTTINTPLVDAVSLTPIYKFGDSPTGTIPIVGTTVESDVTPTVIIYTYMDTRPEGEVPPGPSYPFTINVVGDIASNQFVAPIEFPGEDGGLWY